MQRLRRFRKAIAHWGFIEYALLAIVWGGLSAPLYLHGWGWMSLLSLPLFLTAIVCIAYTAVRFLPMAPSFQRSRTQLIEFFTAKDSIESHGTLSFINGTPRATWTTSTSNTKTTVDGSITESSFRSIWNQVRFLRELQQFRPQAPSEELDYQSSFIVSVMFTDSGQTVSDTYVIPHSCTSTRVNEWLNHIQASHPGAA